MSRPLTLNFQPCCIVLTKAQTTSVKKQLDIVLEDVSVFQSCLLRKEPRAKSGNFICIYIYECSLVKSS